MTAVCVDCIRDGITTRRKVAQVRGKDAPGKRCLTHLRAQRTTRRDTAWERHLMATYGITPDDYHRVMDFQEGVCFICRRANGTSRRLAVDHDHSTGVYRGNLCRSCNRDILGFARDEIEFFQRCIEYLTNPPAVAALGGPRYVP